MTIAATRTRELDIGKICLMAYRLAGLLNENQSLTEVKSSAARDFLETIIKHLQIYGVTARAVVLEVVAITAGTNTYSLAADTFDVLGSAVHIDGADDPENPETVLAMTMVDRERRQIISSEAAEGMPSLFYVDRTTVPVSVWLYPTPSEAGWVRFQVHRLAADSNDATKTPDLERFWAQYLIWELAHQLAVANSINPAKVAHLAGVASQKLIACKAYATPRGTFQFTIDHHTGWSR